MVKKFKDTPLMVNKIEIYQVGLEGGKRKINKRKKSKRHTKKRNKRHTKKRNKRHTKKRN